MPTTNVTQKTLPDATAADRPEDCECTGESYETLPCWYCYAHGFETPNPDAGEED